MKSKIEHCKHYNPNTLFRKETCGRYKHCNYDSSKEDTVCKYRMRFCIGIVKGCEYYED